MDPLRRMREEKKRQLTREGDTEVIEKQGKTQKKAPTRPQQTESLISIVAEKCVRLGGAMGRRKKKLTERKGQRKKQGNNAQFDQKRKET